MQEIRQEVDRVSGDVKCQEMELHLQEMSGDVRGHLDLGGVNTMWSGIDSHAVMDKQQTNPFQPFECQANALWFNRGTGSKPEIQAF